MPIISTGSFAKALLPGIRAWYGMAYNEYPPEFPDLFTEMPSDKAYEEYVGSVGMGLAAIKGEGAPIVYGDMQQGFITRLTNVVYALGFIITWEAQDDNQYDKDARQKSQALAFSVRQTKDIIAANVYNRAFTAAYAGGDGVEMCSASHVNKSGGTWSNILSTSSDFNEKALEQALIDIGKFTDDAGKKIKVMPLALHVPIDLEAEAYRILMSDKQNDTNYNAVNYMKATGQFPQGVKASHYFTDTDAWFIRTNIQNGMIYQNRGGPKTDSVQTDNDFDTENAKFKYMFRAAWGWADPRGVYGSAGA